MRVLLLLSILVVSISSKSQVSDSALRMVRVEGTVNFRDLGGYATSDGHHVKWNKIYRCADISKLTNRDLDTLRERRITYDVDLRGVKESQAAPDRINPNTDYVLCPAGSDNNLSDWMKSISGLTSGGDSMMVVYYSKTDFLADRYRPFFQKLLSVPSDQSLVFHCTAGKDRTGIGAALLLYTLGVPYNTILEDYLATNYYRAGANENMVKQMEARHINAQVAKDMASAKKEYLDATFQAITRQYGSIEKFLKGPIGLSSENIATLKSKFLE
jgi:protein-tyrosine phosphatase